MLLWETEKGIWWLGWGVGGDEMLIADTASEIGPLRAGEEMKNKPKSMWKSMLRGDKAAGLGTFC